MNALEIINLLGKKDFSKVSNIEKNNGYFILNRRMAINFPMQAALLSRMGLTSKIVINFWNHIFKTALKNTNTSWIFLKKGVSNQTIEKNKTYDFSKFSEDTYSIIYKLNNCSYKEIEEMKIKFPNELYEELKKIEKIKSN